jgi:hypothetical protein
MYSLAEVRAEFFLALDSTSKGQFPSLLVVRRLFCPELVMNDLKNASFLYSSVDRTTVGAIYSLSSKSINCLRKRLAGQVLEVGPAEACEVVPSVLLPE